MRAKILMAGLAIALPACTPVPPAPLAPERPPTSVAASFGKTWDSVIDDFAAKNIAIRTIDRASGLIATDPLNVPVPDPYKEHPWADCGKNSMGIVMQPRQATYNVLVRGDSAKSTVRVTVRWTGQSYIDQTTLGECTSRGVWEAEAEASIKQRAEAR